VHVSDARLNTRRLSAPRTGYSCGLALLIFILGSKTLQNAVAEGDTRSITMHHLHTGDDITITYKRNGRYDEAALEKLNWFLRDWRRGEQTRMDPHLIDLVWEVQREADANEPIQVVCGYRAPQTNAMLRRRSGGVAQFSQHMLGHALDFYIAGVSLEHLREIGLRLQRGGVGFYPTSGSPFVHMDTGGVRMWPRMTHEELARVFPDGRTVHIPSDGKPLPGYAVALAEIRKHGGMPSELSLDAARNAGMNVETVLASNARAPVNPFAKLLGLATDDEEDEAAPAATATVASAASPVRAKPAVPVRVANAQPAIEKKPSSADPGRLASDTAEPKLIQVAALLPSAPSNIASEPIDRSAAAATPNEIIRERGYWQGPPDGMAVARSARPPAREASTKPNNAKTATAAIGGPFHDPRDDAAPGATLAYAEQPPAHSPAAASAAATGIAALRATTIAAEPQVRREQALHPEEPGIDEQVVPSGTTIALKRVAHQIASTILSASASSVIAIKAGGRLENPWLRAVLVAPSVHRFLTTLALGTRDFRSLAALMVKPRSAVMMTFATDPNPGLDHEHFTGPAVVFISTVSYPTTRTAILQ
jgi:uncharacterized protein YcbK (DUF882 family)